jgi:hypothetical protein
MVIAMRTPTASDSRPVAMLARLITNVTMAKSPAITRPRTSSGVRNCNP